MKFLGRILAVLLGLAGLAGLALFIPLYCWALGASWTWFNSDRVFAEVTIDVALILCAAAIMAVVIE